MNAAPVFFSATPTGKHDMTTQHNPSAQPSLANPKMLVKPVIINKSSHNPMNWRFNSAKLARAESGYQRLVQLGPKRHRRHRRTDLHPHEIQGRRGP